MKNFVVSLGILAISTMAYGKCPEMAKKAMDGQARRLIPTDRMEDGYPHLFKHYKKEVQPENEIKVEMLRFVLKKNKLMGFEVILTDGGDESRVRYILDDERRPIVAYWKNQSPMTYWFCGENSFPEPEYTAIGSEI